MELARDERVSGAVTALIAILAPTSSGGGTASASRWFLWIGVVDRFLPLPRRAGWSVRAAQDEQREFAEREDDDVELGISLGVFIALYAALLVVDISLWGVRRLSGPAAPQGPTPHPQFLMDLETLWFGLIAVLWAGYFVLEGFDFGVGMLLGCLPHTRRSAADDRTIGPVWDGNEVWLVVAGGATFAAFPAGTRRCSRASTSRCCSSCSSSSSASCRSNGGQERDPRWRAVWTGANAIGASARRSSGASGSRRSSGVPLDSNEEFSGRRSGTCSARTRCSPASRSSLLFAFHGATFLTLRTRGDAAARARRTRARLSLPTAASAVGVPRLDGRVAVDRNDRGVFPPILPAAIAIVALARRRGSLRSDAAAGRSR